MRYNVRILTHEAKSVAASPTPQEHLLQFEHFMAVTAAAVNQQLRWLQLNSAFLDASKYRNFDEQIEAQIEANVSVATDHVGYLAASGIRLMVRNRERLHSLEALAFRPEDGCYSAGIITEEGQTLVPLDGVNALEIGSHPAPPTQLRHPQNPVMTHGIYALPLASRSIGVPLTFYAYDGRI